MRKIIKINEGYMITFSRNNEIRAFVQRIPGRRFDVSEKAWIVPFSSEDHVLRLAEMFDFHMKELDDYANEAFDYTIENLDDLHTDILLNMPMYDYQGKGVQYSIDRKFLINGDDPGLGKTVQSIATVVSLNSFPCLVICPSSLQINWQREIEMWTNLKALILTDSVKRTFPYLYRANVAQFFIVNYESLSKYFVEGIDAHHKSMRLRDIRFNENVTLFKSVIVDEAHRCKELTSQQTKFVKGITSGKESVQLLTGTPVVNKADDLISLLGILNMIGKGKPFGDLKTFKKRFCHTDDYWDRLNVLLRRNCLLRRERGDVLKQLPPKIRNIVTCEINNRTEYNDATNDLVDYLTRYKQASDEQIRRSMRGEVMVRIGILKNIAARGKMASVIDYISDVVESGEKIIIFIHLKEIADILTKLYPAAVTVLGSDSMDQRQTNVDSFQNDPKTQIIVCSIKAAGVGLTLTASHHVVFVEFPWHPADCEQCESRPHRIGQYNPVQCTYLLGKDTIDEWNYYEIIESKRSIVNKITGSTSVVETENYDSLLNFLNMKL